MYVYNMQFVFRLLQWIDWLSIWIIRFNLAARTEFEHKHNEQNFEHIYDDNNQSK